MATRAPFLTQPYGAYCRRDVPQEDEELTHVGPGTPCGESLRRFWQPVALSKRVQELPLRVRLLGEDLVVFRDQSGQVGCLELHCPHRWVRINEYIPPNIRQFPSGGPSARQVHVYRARHTHFTVPVDDTTTMFMGFVRLAEGQEEPRGPGFGQTADRPYEERQRVPGDYDAQTSIHWGLSRHGLEHLATTDRGILMLRNIVRRGIRAVQNGQDPEHVRWEEGKVIPTYANHTVKPAPKAPTPEAEAQLLRDTGRHVAEGYLKDLSSLVEYVA